MLDFLKKKKEIWKANFKTLGSAYSYAKPGDIIVLQEPADALSKAQFENRLEESMYKYKVGKVTELAEVSGYWQIQLERV